MTVLLQHTQSQVHAPPMKALRSRCTTASPRCFAPGR
jgi:hypothetical protein